MKFQEAQKEVLKTLSSKPFLDRIKEEDPNMVKYIPAFKEINAAGFLTINSQSGKQSRGKASVHTGKPYVINERAYMEGFLKEDQAEQFIKNMALHTDKNAILITSCKEANIPPALDIPLTVTESAGNMTINTHMSTVLPETVMTVYRKQLHLNKSEKAVYVFCWDTKWNRAAMSKDGLFKDILRSLKI